MLTLGGLSLPAHAQLPSGGAVAVVSSSNPVQVITRKDIRQFYRGDIKFWEGNVRVKLFVGPKGSDSSRALSAITGDSEKVFMDRWMERSLSGKGKLPSKFSSALDAAEKISENPAGIAIVGSADAESLSILEGDGIRLLPVR